jgi:hypothetical protein
MEFVFEIIFQFLGELFLQILVECLVELGFRYLEDSVSKPRNPVLSTVGFLIWGALAGGLSLLIFPASLIANVQYRTINLVITPLVAGGVMMLIGRAREKRGAHLVGLDRFGYAFVFAFSMAVVRFVWAT